MRLRTTDPLVVIAVVVGISLVVAVVLFGILDSSGVIENKYAKFGGAAAGFFATLILLQRWHGRLASAAMAANDAGELRRRMDPPNFRIPEGYVPYIASEESLAFCYPQSWRQEAQRFDLIFVQRPEQMSSTDPFRGNLNVIVLPTANRTISLRELNALAERRGIERDEVARQIGVELSDTTAQLPVALNKTLAVLGLDAPDFADRLYELEAMAILYEFGVEDLTRDTVYVDGVRSMSQSWTRESEGTTIVQYQTTSYLPRLDVSYIFTFTDDVNDRESIKRTAQEVLATVRFWSPDAEA